MTLLHHWQAPSVVDGLAGADYFSRMLKDWPEPWVIEPNDRRGLTDDQLKQRAAAAAGRRLRKIEIGERIFEQHGWQCDTRQFAQAAHTSRAQAALNELARFGVIRVAKPAKGTRPAKWKWVKETAPHNAGDNPPQPGR